MVFVAHGVADHSNIKNIFRNQGALRSAFFHTHFQISKEDKQHERILDDHSDGVRRNRRLAGLVLGRMCRLALCASGFRSHRLHHRHHVRRGGQEAVQRRRLQGHFQKGAHLRPGRHRAYSRHPCHRQRLGDAYCRHFLLPIERGRVPVGKRCIPGTAHPAEADIRAGAAS